VPIQLSPEVLDDVARIESAFAHARRTYGVKGDFLFGDFSAADAMFAPVLSRFHSYSVPMAPVTHAYMVAMGALPAFKEWQAGADAETWHIEAYDVV
jgi:glutathione S-transferase